MDSENRHEKRSVSILWFRHGLRIHDNPALLEALKNNEDSDFLPIFIFDGESGGTKIVGYNRMRFLIESLEDLNESFNKFGGCIRVLRGDPVELFTRIHEKTNIRKICFEQDCEPIWKPRDSKVRRFCQERGIDVCEFVSHTLWDPSEVLEANGGTPPLTYAAFLFVVSTLAKPPRPLDAPDPNQNIKFYDYDEALPGEMSFPLTPEMFGVEKEDAVTKNYRQGGEQNALALLQKRLVVERAAFERRQYLPNHASPDLTMGISMSPALRFGNVSVRKVYWTIQDLYNEVHGKPVKNGDSSVSSQTHLLQLFWREYFYVMSVPNPHYDKMKPNPICLNIPWSNGVNAKEHLKLWKQGRTGYPFIDAGMRQLLQEGWQHHVTRNAVACFLTRGDLWISWEEGLKHFLKYLLDADWSVCAGNWMWVSSSAFENILDCHYCVCPTNYARRLDPEGNFIRRYVPELRNYEDPYIFEPWTTPIDLQYKWGCIIGRDYPAPIVNHELASTINKQEMLALRKRLQKAPDHLHPFDEHEARTFMWLPDDCCHN